ncbi:MAG: arginase family protein [Candidatus Nanopelagicales bacterium]
MADPNWPRASDWLAESAAVPRFGVLGVPTHLNSISPTAAHRTPVAVRAALSRYSTWSDGRDLADLTCRDLGDVPGPDSPAGQMLVRQVVAGFPGELLLALGGDNSATLPVAQGSGATGLITLDAHHDLRDGHSNGSPVRELLASGLPGERIVQIGIADFANSAYYAARARAAGITVISRAEVRARGMAAVISEAMQIAGAGPDPRIHVDLDVDVCDRAFAPACPASAPGGLSASELREAARLTGADPRVVSMDLVEVDADADTPDGRTVRLTALCLLEAAVGLLER